MIRCSWVLHPVVSAHRLNHAIHRGVHHAHHVARVHRRAVAVWTCVTIPIAGAAMGGAYIYNNIPPGGWFGSEYGAAGCCGASGFIGVPASGVINIPSDQTPATVPEPSSLLLMLPALFILWIVRKHLSLR